ncbi:hypothetical protein H5410_001541 [Solanum commersonii]|uniref:Uncharacterized protein n=1 Tax=Solanum commersonii TaxID=4109 RepID=A0A9J6AZC4_SOLCO|nr:hypothetical protein H5410_001541 [Solanum commersonii]
MDPPWVTKARGMGSYTRRRGRSSYFLTSGSSYGSSSNSPIIQRGGMSLVKLTSPSKEATSSIHLDDIPENNPLYAQLKAYLSQKQSDTFASVVKEEIDDIRSYEKVAKKEIIFLLENSEIQRKKNLGRYSRDIYLTDYTSQESHTKPARIRDHFNKYSKVLYYNNERHKHTWFIKVCAKIFVDPIPNWFLNWWSYHGPTIYYNNFWDKLMKNDPMTKSLYGQELLDSISQKIQDYGNIPHKEIIVDNSVKHIARRISIEDGNKEEMIKEYLDEVRRNLLLNITHYEKSDTSMRSETSDDIADNAQEAQPCESEKPVTEDMLSKAEDFLRELKKKDKRNTID